MTTNQPTNPFILTFGSCGWDRKFFKYKDGRTELILEEEGRKNSHQAIAALRAGAGRSMLISYVGDDEIGRKCLESLNQSGIDTRYIQVIKGEATEINELYVDEVTRDYSLKRGPAELSQRYFVNDVEKYKEWILKADFVILVSKQPKDFLETIINFCYENNIPTVMTISHAKFDVDNKEDLKNLRKCTVIAANFEEAERDTKKKTPEEMLGVLPNMIVTKGPDGVWFKDEKGRICRQSAVPPIPPDKIIDADGSGDTFIGNFIVFRTEGKSISDSMRLAVCAATINASRMGVLHSMPSRKETETLYRKRFKDAQK